MPVRPIHHRGDGEAGAIGSRHGAHIGENAANVADSAARALVWRLWRQLSVAMAPRRHREFGAARRSNTRSAASSNGCTRARSSMRRLEKVRAEFSLTALAYNLRRALNILGMDKMMAALAA